MNVDTTGTVDPLELGRVLWPNVRFYGKQEEIIYSVWENNETIVPAGNELGKDFVAAFIILVFFLSRYPCRVVTTSADYAQLESVLWGELRRFIQTAKYPLDSAKGGCIVVNHMHLKRVYNGAVCGVSYVIGRVAKKGEGLLGHHVSQESGAFIEDGIPRTLFVADEASGVEDVAYERADTWAERKLIIGNPFPTTNFFYKAVKGGDILHKGRQ